MKSCCAATAAVEQGCAAPVVPCGLLLEAGPAVVRIAALVVAPPGVIVLVPVAVDVVVGVACPPLSDVAGASCAVEGAPISSHVLEFTGGLYARRLNEKSRTQCVEAAWPQAQNIWGQLLAP